MAEFQEVIKHWGRMLDSHKHGESIAFEASVPADAFKDAKLVEEIVMKWAAEHPEPVYPTWVEYLVGIGVIPHEIRLETADALMDTHLLKPIRADIAQKLGIEPKEG